MCCWFLDSLSSFWRKRVWKLVKWLLCVGIDRCTAGQADHCIPWSRNCSSLYTGVHAHCKWEILYVDIFVIKRWVLQMICDDSRLSYSRGSKNAEIIKWSLLLTIRLPGCQCDTEWYHLFIIFAVFDLLLFRREMKFGWFYNISSSSIISMSGVFVKLT